MLRRILTSPLRIGKNWKCTRRYGGIGDYHTEGTDLEMYILLAILWIAMLSVCGLVIYIVIWLYTL